MRKHGLFLLLVLGGLTALSLALRLSRANREQRLPPPSVAGLRSWQLVGWREQGGKKEPWAMHYQASSLFYKETIGQAFVVITDEATLLHYFLPNNPSQAVAILAPPRQIRPTLPAYIERASKDTDPATGLPTRFQWRRQNELLTEFVATYNQPLSPETLRTDLPKGTTLIDLLRETGPKPAPGQTTQGAFTVKAAAEQDPSGMLHVSLSYWLGANRVEGSFPLKVVARLLSRNTEERNYVPLSLNPHRWMEAISLNEPSTDSSAGKRLPLMSGAWEAGVPIGPDQYFYLRNPLTPSAPVKDLVLPLHLEAAFRQPPPTRIAANLALSTELRLRVPVRQRSTRFPDSPYGPLEALVLEQKGNWQEAIQVRQRWKPPTEAQAADNKNAILALRSTGTSKNRSRQPAMTAK